MNKLFTIKRYTLGWQLMSVFMLMFIALTFTASAQNIFSNPQLKATARLDTNKILIGQQTQLHLQLITPEKILVQWPTIGDTLCKNVEVIRHSAIDTINLGKDGLISLNQTITISSFDSGYFAIPPFFFMYAPVIDSLNNTMDFVESNALLLEVHNVKVDLKKGIKDIKPIIEEPWTFGEILPYILLALGIILLIALAFYIYKRKKQHKPIFSLPQKPKVLAHITAIQKLDLLKEKKLWQSGAIKEFYSELTDIIRAYMEDRMQFKAVEMISDEILEELQKQNLSDELYKQSQEILQTADLVKFAKVKPMADENDRALKWAYTFVEQTKPGDEKPIEEESKSIIEPLKTDEQ